MLNREGRSITIHESAFLESVFCYANTHGSRTILREEQSSLDCCQTPQQGMNNKERNSREILVRKIQILKLYYELLKFYTKNHSVRLK